MEKLTSESEATSGAKEVAIPAKDGTRAPAIAAILAAILLCACYFAPFTIADAGSAPTTEIASTIELVEGSGIMASELASPSLVKWADVYKAYSDHLANGLNDATLMYWAIVASAGSALLAALFALLRKATPVVLLGGINIAALVFVNFYFTTYGPVSSSASSSWAWGHMALFAAAGALLAAGIWLFVAKWRQKRGV